MPFPPGRLGGLPPSALDPSSAMLCGTRATRVRLLRRAPDIASLATGSSVSPLLWLRPRRRGWPRLTPLNKRAALADVVSRSVYACRVFFGIVYVFPGERKGGTRCNSNGTRKGSFVPLCSGCGGCVAMVDRGRLHCTAYWQGSSTMRVLTMHFNSWGWVCVKAREQIKCHSLCSGSMREY